MAEKQRFYTDRALWALFIPLMIEQGLSMLLGLADSVMVAQVGEWAVSGVSVVDFIMTLFIFLFSALASGGGSVTGQFLGMGRQDLAEQSINQLTKFALYFSLFLTACAYVLRPLILSALFGTLEPAVKAAAEEYFGIVMLSVPIVALYNCGAAHFRTLNDSKLPMKIMLVMNGLNAAGNALLVFGFHMGVAGIAIPTLISRAGAAFWVLAMARKPRQEGVRIKGFALCPWQGGLIKKILSIGAPFAFENGMFSFGRLLVLSIVALSGTAAIAANSVGSSIMLFQTLPGAALNMGLSVVIARCVGAADEEQARFYARRIIAMIHRTFMVSSVLVTAALPLLLKIYGLSEQAERWVWMIVLLHGGFQVLIWPESFALPVVLRAAGDAAFPMTVSILSMAAVRIGCAYLLAVTFGLGMMGTWYAMIADWAVRALFFIARYRSGQWLQYRVRAD